MTAKLHESCLRSIVFVAAIALATVGHAQEAESIDAILGEDQSADEYSDLEQRIARAEGASAIRELEVVLQQIEAVHHQSHPDLVRPMTLLGDAQFSLGEFDAALDTYSRAKHITRVNYGLFDTAQLELVYREADTLHRLGLLDDARDQEEYAYEIMKKGFDAYDPDLIPGLERLAEFYLGTFNYLAARVFFKKAMDVHGANGSDMTLAAVPILRGIAYTYRMERFPPYYIASMEDTRASGPTPGLDETELGQQHITINNFPEGERALQTVVEIVQRQVPPDPEAVRASMLELADWHLLWDRSNEANTLYSYIYNEMAAVGENASEFFGSPTLIHLPEPHPPKPPPIERRLAEEQGIVTLEFQVTRSGRIRKLKTVHSHPPKMMEFQIRRSLRQAVFRPYLLEGVPQIVENHTYTYEFPYFPSRTIVPDTQVAPRDNAGDGVHSGSEDEQSVES